MIGNKDGGMMVITSDGALLVLQRWLSNSTPLWCTVEAFSVGVQSQGRIAKVDADSFTFESEDGKTSLSVGFSDPEIRLVYEEPRSLADSNPERYPELSEEQRFASSLSVAFPLRARVSNPADVPSRPEKVFVVELIG
jgi:hypothetical protein